MASSTTFEDIVIPVADIEIQQLVGSGGYGDVWKAVWKGRGGGLEVAVKKIRVSAFNENTKREIYEEVHILRRLSYRHVLQIYGVCITDNHELWMVLDFMDGGNLYEYLKISLDISLATRLKFMLQAALAINFLHSGKPQILHRDIKSPNFLISKDTLDIKLTDFGTSKITSVATNTTSSTRSPATVGSHRWAAPETTSMNPVWTEKADIYSLGMTFYEIVTGRIPFDQVTENYQVIYLVIQDKARPPIPQDCPRELHELISRCWHHEPEKRPSSQEVVKILSDLTSSPTFASIPASPSPKGRKFFEVNEDLLLRTVPPECITTLTAPPSFPGNPQEAAKLQLPKHVKVVVLKKSNINPLISNTYDVQIFDRVEVYFRRFFAAHDSMKVTLDQVDVVFNPSIEQRFRDAEEALHNSCKGVEEFKDPKQSDLQRDYLSHLLPSENLYKNRNSNPISVWHGANSNKIESIQWYGMLNLTSNDPGFFGKAMYFTQHPKYGEYYAAQLQDRTEGRFNLLLCWALLGKPWAQTKVNMGAPCQKGYTSHYTVVTKKRAHEGFCEDTKNYEQVEGLETYFPILTGEQVKGDEIALFDPSHVLPRFIVHYTVEKNQTDFVPKPRGDGRAADPKPKSKPKPKPTDSKDPPGGPFTRAGQVTTLAGSDKGLKDGTKDSAKFHHPNGLCFHSGEKCLYVCDTENKTIRKINAQGAVTSFTFLEEGKPVLKGPVAIALFRKENSFFVIDESLHSIFKLQSGKLTLFAGKNGKRGNQDGTGANASFNIPWCLTIDQETGNIYVADRGNYVIRMITQQGVVSTICGVGQRGFEDGATAKFTDLRGIVYYPPEKALIVCDNGNRKVRKISLPGGEVSTIFDKINPRAITITSDGILFVATLDQIFRLTTTNNPDKVVIAGQYTVFPKCVDGNALECRFGDIHGMTLDEETQTCFITDHYHSKIRKLSFS